VKDSCGGRYGYFSAHAANSFALAFFFVMGFTRYFRPLPLFLFLWAAMVAYSRVYIGVHFPLDVFTGMLVGLLNASIFYGLFTRAAGKLKIA
jgi:undecaprenyl-diphosphatase